MTKEEQNNIITEAWTRNLRKGTNIPENIGTMFTSWLRGLIKQANEQILIAEQQGPAQQGQTPVQQNTSGQEEAENAGA